MPDYLSTDPDEGVAAGYLSTDPNEGETAAPTSRLRPGATESNEAFIERSIDAWGDATLPGLTQVGGAVGPLRQFLGRLAPGLMRNALGARQSIRSKFPTVDLDAVALREGAIPGNKASIAAVGQAARAAGGAVNDAARASTARVGPRQLIGALRPIAEQAARAHGDDAMQAVVSRMRQIGKEVPREGLSMTEAQARKQVLAQRGKVARTAPTPKEAGMGAQIADVERKALASAQRGGGMADALDRSQELMALERAMGKTGQRTSLLRDAVASGVGTATGMAAGGAVGGLVMGPAALAVNRLMTSPQVLGRTANLLHRTGSTPAAGELQALIAQLLAGHEAAR